MIPFDAMWERLNRLIKPNGAIVLFGSQPFTSTLIMSNIKCFKHSWVYQKRCSSNFAQAKYAPMKEHEDVIIFANGKANYYPIKELRKGGGANRVLYSFNSTQSGEFTSIRDSCPAPELLRFPSSVREFNNRAAGQRGQHPTQKPVALMEYLIKTYTNDDELILDFTMGSGTTCVAAYNTGRKCIGIEMDDKYFEVAKQRVSDAINTKAAQLF